MVPTVEALSTLLPLPLLPTVRLISLVGIIMFDFWGFAGVIGEPQWLGIGDGDPGRSQDGLGEVLRHFGQMKILRWRETLDRSWEGTASRDTSCEVIYGGIVEI